MDLMTIFYPVLWDCAIGQLLRINERARTTDSTTTTSLSNSISIETKSVISMSFNFVAMM